MSGSVTSRPTWSASPLRDGFARSAAGVVADGCTSTAYRERKLRGATESAQLATVRIVVFICTRCSATWRVLPAFLARGLWRTWLVVASVLLGSRGQHEPVIPARTRQRWLRRWAGSARVPGQLLASSGSEPLRAVVRAVGLDCTRSALFDAYAKATLCPEPFAALAALLHRLGRGCVSCSSRGSARWAGRFRPGRLIPP